MSDFSKDTADAYLAGLVLSGRRVVVVGGGSLAVRRVPRLLDAGARLRVVAPRVGVGVEALAAAGALEWVRRRFEPADLDGAWYVLAATDDPEVNAAVSAEAERLRVFCVRGDDASSGSATTPAVGSSGPVCVGVLSGGDHVRSARVRDHLVSVLRDGSGLDVSGEARDRRGSVAIVGGGPGDPDLITVRGARLVAAADVVVVDRLAPRGLLEGLRPDAEVVDAAKMPYGSGASQDVVNATMIRRALQGRFVVRLKGGDPFVFGRGFEELQALAAAGVPTTVVPGVSSALAAPALAGIPLTHRGLVHEVVVVSGHVAPHHPGCRVDWGRLAWSSATVVVLMGLANAGAIASALIAAGADPERPVSVVADASGPGQMRVDTTLGGLDVTVRERGGPGGEAVRSPAVLVIGPVVALAQSLEASSGVAALAGSGFAAPRARVVGVS